MCGLPQKYRTGLSISLKVQEIIKLQHFKRKIEHPNLLAPSGALVFIMVYYIPAAATFSNFSNSSDSKVKVKVKGPNMCYIFEKHGIQGYRI